MRDKEEFFSILSSIDGGEFSEYVKLVGDFDFSRYVLKINQVPRESEGRSTLILVRVPQIITGFPAEPLRHARAPHRARGFPDPENFRAYRRAGPVRCERHLPPPHVHRMPGPENPAALVARGDGGVH